MSQLSNISQRGTLSVTIHKVRAANSVIQLFISCVTETYEKLGLRCAKFRLILASLLSGGDLQLFKPSSIEVLFLGGSSSMEVVLNIF